MKKNVWIIKVQRCGQHLGYCEYNCCANGEDVGGGSGSAISNLITPIIRAWRASLGTNTNRVIFQLILYVYLDWHYTNVISFTRIYNSNSVSMGPNTSTHQLLPSFFFPSSYIFWNKVKKIIWKFHNFASIDRIYIANNIFFFGPMYSWRQNVNFRYVCLSIVRPYNNQLVDQYVQMRRMKQMQSKCNIPLAAHKVPIKLKLPPLALTFCL